MSPMAMVRGGMRALFDLSPERTGHNLRSGGLLSPGPSLVARPACHHSLDPIHRDAGQPLWCDPDHVRVIFAPPVAQSERERVIARRAMSAKVAVAAPHDLVLRVCLLDHLGREGHFVLRRLSVGVASFHGSDSLRGKRNWKY